MKRYEGPFTFEAVEGLEPPLAELNRAGGGYKSPYMPLWDTFAQKAGPMIDGGKYSQWVPYRITLGNSEAAEVAAESLKSWAKRSGQNYKIQAAVVDGLIWARKVAL